MAQNQTTSQPLLLTWPLLVMVIGLSGVQSESNWVSDLKSAELVAWGWFEITSTIIPEHEVPEHEVLLPINWVNNKIRETL